MSDIFTCKESFSGGLMYGFCSNMSTLRHYPMTTCLYTVYLVNKTSRLWLEHNLRLSVKPFSPVSTLSATNQTLLDSAVKWKPDPDILVELGIKQGYEPVAGKQISPRSSVYPRLGESAGGQCCGFHLSGCPRIAGGSRFLIGLGVEMVSIWGQGF